MSFYLFRRYFLSSRSGSLIKVVSWVCTAGMAVSLSALILIVSIMGGFGKAIKSRLLSKSAHLILQFEDNPFLKKNLVHKKTHNKKKSLLFDREENPIIFSTLNQEQQEGIKDAFIFESQELILQSSRGFKGVSAVGYSDERWTAKLLQKNEEIQTDLEFVAPPEDLQNKPLPLKQDQEKEVLISYELAMEMDLNPGDELTLIPLAGLLLPPNLFPPIKRFQVKAILNPTDTKKEGFFIYYKQGLMDFGDFSKVHFGAEIHLYDPEQAVLYQNFFKKYKSQNWMDRNSTLFFALKLEKFIMTLFLALALIVSCLGISSALFLLITQKSEDLAILHAMGLSQKEIVKIFTGVGLSLAFIGLVAGAFIGFSGTAFLKYNDWNILPEMYQDRTIPAIFMPLNYLIILSGAFLLSWISCYLPIKYFSRIKPATLLKISGF